MQILPLADLPVAVSLEAPWTDLEMREVGDLDGDGWTDALVHLTVGAESLDGVLRGPLHEPHVLPRDLWVTTDEWTWLSVGEYDADGVLDVVLWFDDVDRKWLLPGPFDGVLAPGPDAVSLPWEMGLTDVDYDGIVDGYTVTESADGAHGAEIVWGPLTDPPRPADVVVTSVCEDKYGSVDYPMPAGDIDGDGLPELTSWSWWCPGYTVSIPRSGVVDLATAPASEAVSGIAVGDRTGDGLPEFFDSSGVRLSPITLTPDGLAAAGMVGVDDAMPWIRPATFDVDGDALLDWVVVVRTDDSSYALALATGGGPTEVQALGVEVPSGMPEVVSWADGGVARVLVEDGAVWRVGELGPAF